MTVDIEKLEALAKAAKSGGAEWSDLTVDTERMYTAEGMLVELYEFATPTVLLELCSDNEALRGLYQIHKQTEAREMRELKAELAGLKTGYEAYERVNDELAQRIANLELCQTASLGVSGIIKSAASELGFDAAGEDSALDYLIGLARSAAELRAECEALRNRQSFSDAFYEVSALLGVTGARPEAPLVVFRQEVVPALQAVIRNSKRYEWLKQNATVMLKKMVSYTTSLGLMQTCYPSAMEVDAALDAAMSEEQSHD
ncbi:hypothetical protein [Pseudomonas syringae]|uniref:hypothetical protein n=1 Tax=Pseudomonas syringae TaxID=317 RepID=UPI000409EC1D|nr:hypothetical protein [Pseudomonas syringae]